MLHSRSGEVKDARAVLALHPRVLRVSESTLGVMVMLRLVAAFELHGAMLHGRRSFVAYHDVVDRLRLVWRDCPEL